MVVTANPEATRAGVEILEAGGSAVDAAVAIEAVLSLVEPQSSGFAGGGFMVYRDAATGEITVYDGRETAPASVDPRQFVLEDGKPMGFLDAKNSGLSTGVPGVVDMLALAQGEQGALSWDVLLEPAIALAEGGFEVSPRLHGMLARFGRILPRTPEQGPTDAFDYFYDAEGNPHPVGYRLKNAAYAETLRALQADPRAINEGPIADAIVNAVGQAPRAGSMTRADLKAYRARKREPLCAPYQELTLCGPPPPASWVAVAMTLGILERGPAFSDAGAEDPSNWALFAEAQRLAYADRDFYVGDAAYVDVPIAGMLSDGYLAARAEQLDPEQAATTVLPGDPFAFQSASRGPMPGVDATLDVAGTTHFVVVDGDGNVVSMTATVESIFGSLRMVGGMFLNNQLTDFSFLPTDADGRPVANAVAGGKRPRSSMSPTIVLDDTGQFLLASGSPGGNSIIAYTAKSLLGVLEWGLSPAEAVALPNLVGRGDVVRLEKDLASPELIEALEAYGLEVDASRGENSGLSMVLRLPDGSLVGGADPRREGVVGRAAIPAD
ncbi:MAG: gamma-glutamyltransferase family protein [Pseudomonadota bacterium]